MKKVLAAVLALVLALGMTAYADFPDVQNSGYDEKAIFDVSSFGIMQGYEDGTFRPDRDVTRAEFSKIALAAMGVSDAAQQETEFSDVPKEHWASGYIDYASDLGLIVGFGDGTFLPDGNVTANQAVKILVCILGRQEEAEKHGGYPTGYLYSASRCSLLKGITAKSEENLTRGEVAKMVYNALDAQMMQPKFSGGGYELSDETLRSRLEKMSGLTKIRGVVTATEYTSLDGNKELDDGYAEVDGVKYKTAIDMSDALGYRVDIYVNEDENNRIETYVKYGNTEWEFDADDLSSVSASDIKWFAGNDKDKKVSLDDAACIYNGKRSAALKEIYNGTYKLVDNDDDNRAEVVLITESEAFVVDRTNANTVYFANDALFRGKTAFKLSDKTDYKYVLRDFDGNDIEFKDIKADMSMIITSSEDEMLTFITVGDKSVTGTIQAIDSHNNEITIEGKTHKIRKNARGDQPEFGVGDTGTFALDDKDRIIDVIGDIEESGLYGYVTKAGKTDDIDSSLEIRVVTSGRREKKTDIVADKEIISYDFANSTAQILGFADNVKLDGVRVSASSLDPARFEGNVINYSLNSDGLINKCKVYQITNSTTSYSFNAKLQSFGGYAGRDAFFADSAAVICVPEIADSDDDYYEKVTLTHEGTYNVKPIEIDEKTQKAKAAVVIAKMDADSLQPIESDKEVSIVWNVSEVVDDNGENGLKITLLTGGEIEDIIADGSTQMYNTAKTLRKGDLLKYSLNAFDKLSNLQILASVQGLTDYYRAYENSPSETVYAIVNTLGINRLSQLRNQMVDEITVVFREDGSGQVVAYDIPREDGPTIYKYTRSNGDIEVATCEEMTSFEEVGAEASRVFMQVKNNDVQTVVIIE